jgi:hypothetical protein
MEVKKEKSPEEKGLFCALHFAPPAARLPIVLFRAATDFVWQCGRSAHMGNLKDFRLESVTEEIKIAFNLIPSLSAFDAYKLYAFLEILFCISWNAILA